MPLSCFTEFGVSGVKPRGIYVNQYDLSG